MKKAPEEDEQEEANSEDESEQGEPVEVFDVFCHPELSILFFNFGFYLITAAEEARSFLKLTPEQQLRLRSKKLMERKLRIANLGSVILADPNPNVRLHGYTPRSRSRQESDLY